jgi:SAM-dependent methyltransferase
MATVTSKKRKVGAASRAARAAADPYAAFAAVYDEYMNHVPYAAWADYLLRRHVSLVGRRPAAVLDLACGTGLLLEHLQGRVERVLGLDGSAAMLARARFRLPGLDLKQGRIDRRLPYRDGSAPWLLCTHDSLNYLTAARDLSAHLRQAARVLAPGGLYSTDLVSLHNIVTYFDGQEARYRFRGCRLRWGNAYDRTTRIMQSDLEFQYADGRTLYEVHRQRYYEPDELLEAARAAGLELVARDGDYERRAPRKRDNLWNFHFRAGAGAMERPA